MATSVPGDFGDVWYEAKHKEGGLPSFRIVEDDGCYIVLRRDSGKPENAEDAWVISEWPITPEVYDVLIQMPRPRGGIYEIDRDGELPAHMTEAEHEAWFDALVEERFRKHEEAREAFKKKMAERDARKN